MSVTAGTTAAAAFIAVAGFGEEFFNRKFNIAENVAGRIVRLCALFLRNTEIIYRHEHLHIADELNDREYSERDIKRAFAGIRNIAADKRERPARERAAGAFALAADLRIEHDRIDRLNSASRQICVCNHFAVLTAGNGSGRKSLNGTFTAAEYDAF